MFAIVVIGTSGMVVGFNHHRKTMLTLCKAGRYRYRSNPGICVRQVPAPFHFSDVNLFTSKTIDFAALCTQRPYIGMLRERK